ncbi:VCBS domain-containing protein [Vibrio lentus]|nr:VCBS domain-containing protein [Vibrio lentus]
MHSGTWVYHLDNSNPQSTPPNNNDTLQDKFTLFVDDGHAFLKKYCKKLR